MQHEGIPTPTRFWRFDRENRGKCNELNANAPRWFMVCTFGNTTFWPEYPSFPPLPDYPQKWCPDDNSTCPLRCICVSRSQLGIDDSGDPHFYQFWPSGHADIPNLPSRHRVHTLPTCTTPQLVSPTSPTCSSQSYIRTEFPGS